MHFAFYLVPFLFILAVESRDKDIDDEAYETEKLVYCPKAERWWRCGTGCERSCIHPEQPSFKDCKRPCIPYSCRCKPGYLRDNSGTGHCVRPENCKKWDENDDKKPKTTTKEPRRRKKTKKVPKKKSSDSYSYDD